MRTIVSDYNKEKLARKVFKMAENGWEPVTKIMNTDNGYYMGTFTYMCVMETERDLSGKAQFNNPWTV